MWKKSATNNLLRCMVAGMAVLAVSLVAPQLPHQLLRAYMRERKFQRGKFLNDLKRLQDRKLIRYTVLPNNEVRIALSRQGNDFARKLVLQYDIENMKIEKPALWDKKWRLVMFDIPHKQSRARDVLREKIRSLGFYQLQKSVFIYPYPCEKEIEFTATFYGVRRHVLLVTVSHFEGQEKLARSVFHLQ